MLELDRNNVAAEEGVRRFAVASYNVHRCIGTDGRRDPGRVGRVLLELDAQIIGLQEVESKSGGELKDAQIDYLAQATKLEAVAGRTIQRADSSYGNVLLTRYPIDEINLIDLSVPGREPRGAIDAMLDIHGRAVRVIVTHLGLTAAERRNQAERLMHIILNQREQPVILLGDTNGWHPLSGAIRTLHRCLGKTPAKPTYPARFPLLALDRIWVRPREALETVSPHKSPLAKIASDHLPLKVNVELDQSM